MPSSSSSIPKARILPSKEASLFKELLTLYETRQLKKALKTADAILKKHPEHGETLCMKGLVLTHLGRREEGAEMVKRGVRSDLTSHICWHVFGLMQKGEKNYEEALKSYSQALRFDKDNLNILRDAAHLQTQLRLYDALVDTRAVLLRLRPNLRQHWIALAVAYYLAGSLAAARAVVEHYESTVKHVPAGDIEHSATLLFHVRILEELGECAAAVRLLDSPAIVDQAAVVQTRARLATSLASDTAADAWRALIDHNSDCCEHYTAFLATHPPQDSLALLASLATALPRATAPQRLALTLSSPSGFPALAKPYILTRIARGVPSLYSDIKALYTDPAKRSAVQSILEDALSSSPDDPSAHLWTLYFLAMHHSTHSLPTALSYLSTALAHTPTLPELYTSKARILKRAGDLTGALRAMEEARALDGQDRFLNGKCWKYLLRAAGISGGGDLIKRASEVAGLFTKKDAPSPAADLEDMQSLLFLTEEASAYLRLGNLGLALKRYTSLHKIFTEVLDDQYDFHGYSIRKFMINVYLDMLKWEDTIRAHPVHVKAVCEASKILVRVYDRPEEGKGKEGEGAKMTEEQKKARKKAAKKAKLSSSTTVAATPSSTSTSAADANNEDKGLEPPILKDDDPDGNKALNAPDPLERAWKMLGPVVVLAEGGKMKRDEKRGKGVGEEVEMWCVVYDVAVRRAKWLQAIKALNYACKLDAGHPEVHIRVVDVAVRVPPPSSSPAIQRIIKKTRASLLSIDEPELEGEIEAIPTEKLASFNSLYIQHPHPPHVRGRAVLASARVQKRLGASREEVEGTLFTIFPESPSELEEGEGVGWRDALDCLLFFDEGGRKEEFRKRCREVFRLATVFDSDSGEGEVLETGKRSEEDGDVEVKDA